MVVTTEAGSPRAGAGAEAPEPVARGGRSSRWAGCRSHSSRAPRSGPCRSVCCRRTRTAPGCHCRPWASCRDLARAADRLARAVRGDERAGADRRDRRGGPAALVTGRGETGRHRPGTRPLPVPAARGGDRCRHRRVLHLHLLHVRHRLPHRRRGISPLPRRGARGGIDVGSFFGGSVLGAHGPHGVAVLGLCFAAAGLLPLLAEELLSRLAAVRRPRGPADPCS